jgi:hypothetical protein
MQFHLFRSCLKHQLFWQYLNSLLTSCYSRPYLFQAYTCLLVSPFELMCQYLLKRPVLRYPYCGTFLDLFSFANCLVFWRFNTTCPESISFFIGSHFTLINKEKFWTKAKREIILAKLQIICFFLSKTIGIFSIRKSTDSPCPSKITDSFHWGLVPAVVHQHQNYIYQ